MELKPGYKQTEVGVIPEDWTDPQLCDLGTVIRGASPRPKGDKRFYGGEIPRLMVEDVTRDGKYVTPQVDFLTEEGAKRSRPCKAGTLTIVCSGTVGVPSILAVDACIHDGFLALINLKQSQCVEYLYYQFDLLRTRFDSSATHGGVFTNLTTTGVKEFKVPLPLLEDERSQIATALNDADALLDGLDRLIAKKRDIKQAAMQQLLTGETRLPGFEGKWEPLNMAQDSTLKARIGWQGLTTAEYLKSGQYALVTGTDFFDGKIDWYGCHFVEKERYDQDRYIQLQINDVLLTKDGTIGKAAFVDKLPYPATLNSGVFVIRPKNGSYVPEYFFYVLRSQIFVDFLNKLQAGSTISHLYQKDFVNFEFLAPVTVEEQSAISNVLSDMDAEIATLEQRRAKIACLKQAMMQELLTGKTRLVEQQLSDEQAEAASSSAKGHNWAINEAVVIATLVKHFGKEDYPLGRKRYTKLAYLLHRRFEQQAEGYLKKAAGPYNPQTRYGGPEKIAKQNAYITQHRGPKGHSGFIAADNIAQAEDYFEKWYGQEVIQWLEQFRFKSNDELEVLATVDMAVVELRTSGKRVDVEAVKDVIAGHPEWEAKLDRAAFSDENIAGAIKQSDTLLGYESVGGSNA